MQTITGVATYGNVWNAAPDDSTQVQAAHVRECATIALNNTRWIREKLIEIESNGNDPPALAVAGVRTIQTTSYQPIEAVIFTAAKVGDVVTVTSTGTSRLSGPGAIGRFRIAFVEDVGGTPIDNPIDTSRIITEQYDETPYCVSATWVVANAGDLMVVCEGSLEVFSLGAQIELTRATRIDAMLVRRTI